MKNLVLEKLFGDDSIEEIERALSKAAEQRMAEINELTEEQLDSELALTGATAQVEKAKRFTQEIANKYSGN